MYSILYCIAFCTVYLYNSKCSYSITFFLFRAIHPVVLKLGRGIPEGMVIHSRTPLLPTSLWNLVSFGGDFQLFNIQWLTIFVTCFCWAVKSYILGTDTVDEMYVMHVVCYSACSGWRSWWLTFFGSDTYFVLQTTYGNW